MVRRLAQAPQDEGMEPTVTQQHWREARRAAGQIGSRNFRPSTGFVRYPERVGDHNGSEISEAENENDPP